MRQSFLGLTFCAIFLLAIALVGCGGSNSISGGPPPPPASVPVSLTIGDDPPVGVAPLRFQVQITSATLQPQNTNKSPVSMLLGPLNVELLHLQTETAPLGNVSVPEGTYTSLTATFANPQVTIFNNTGQTLNVGAQSCAANQICNLNLTLNQATATVQAPTAPFPVTLSANSPLGFEMHFDVNASLQGDLTVTPQITLKQVIPPTATTPIDLFHIVGRVTMLNSPSFTIQAGFGNLSAAIVTNSTTTFDFGNACAAENFSCLATGQVVGVAVNLLPDGTLVAARVRLLEQQNLPSLQGIIVSVNTSLSQFNMVLADLQEQFTSVNFGALVTVHLDSAATFAVDADGVTIPSGLSFASKTDLLPGQFVEVHPSATPVVTPTAGPPLINLNVNSVSLEATEISGTVGSVNTGGNPPDFTLAALSPFLTHASISLIQVDSVTGTQFINVSGLSGLTAGDKVSVGGLLFNTSTTPSIVAERVRKH
jgi:hypothetical protein